MIRFAMRRDGVSRGGFPGSDAARRIARAVEYIEANLGRPLALEEAAEAACWSFFHFHRIFAAVMGIGPGEYLRRRRLAEAAADLALGTDTVRRIAAARGFGSAESMSRSFHAAFGVTPIQYRRAGPGNRRAGPFAPVSRPLLSRPVCLRAEPELLDFGPRNLVAFSFVCPPEGTELARRIVSFWEKRCACLLALPGRVQGRAYGLAVPDSAGPGGAIRYLAAVELEPGSRIPQGFESRIIPAGRYARATVEGPLSAVQEAYLYLYGSWLPRRGLEPRESFDFDVYDASFPPGIPAGDSRIEIFIPLAPQEAA